MLRRVGIGLLWVQAGYLLGAFGGGLLINLLSTNRFDRGMEAAMTGAFVTGPLAATVAFVVGVIRAGHPAGQAVS